MASFLCALKDFDESKTTAPVITANALRGHEDIFISRNTYIANGLFVNGVHVSDEHNRSLPVNENKTQSVEWQEKDENSLLNTVKKLIKLRNENAALNADAALKVLRCDNGGYPLVYERTDGKTSFVIAINPSERAAEIERYGKVVLCQNCQENGSKLTLSGKSFAIMQR